MLYEVITFIIWIINLFLFITLYFNGLTKVFTIGSEIKLYIQKKFPKKKKIE